MTSPLDVPLRTNHAGKLRGPVQTKRREPGGAAQREMIRGIALVIIVYAVAQLVEERNQLAMLE